MYFELCTEEQLRDFYDEFGVTEESIQNDVRHLMEWLEKQPHLPIVKDEKYLANFLLRCKNSMAKAKRKLESFYLIRSAMPEIFLNYDPCAPGITENLNVHAFIHLPKLTPEGHRIVVQRIFGTGDKPLPNLDDGLKGVQMGLDITLKEDFSRGMIFIVDYENIDMRLLARYLSSVRQLATLMTKAFPLRFQKLYFLNISSPADRMVKLLKSFMKSYLAERVQVWTKKPTDLVEVLPKDVLPSDYGGTEKSLMELKDLWAEYLRENREWFLAQENMKADLSKVPKDSPCKDEISEFGIEGSFRRIAVD